MTLQEFAISRSKITVLIVLCILPECASAEFPGGQGIKVNNCFLRTFEEANIPALERGPIARIHCELGEIVEAGMLLAHLDDTESAIDLEVAQLELRIAEEKHRGSVAVQINEARLTETQRGIEQSQFKQRIAEQAADSHVKLNKATKSRDTALVELNRAIAARKEFSGSVSDKELDRLQYLKDQADLDIVAAQEALAISQLEVQVEQAVVGTARALVQKIQHELTQSKNDHAVKDIELELLRKKVELAEQLRDRRSMIAPFSGMLIEQFHHQGEWLEIGQPVFRIMRLDRLVVEGYANADDVHHSMRGAEVEVIAETPTGQQTFSGKLSFVSPSVDPVNGQVQIRAVIENRQGILRAGEAVELMINAN